jgi:phosphoribosylglycinamide formyltransferase-1
MTIRQNSRWAVFISGRGSNLQALLDFLPEVDVRWVLSSKSEAQGLIRARRFGIPFEVLPSKIDWKKLDLDLRRRGITHLFLAGFMKMIPAEFVQAWAGRMLNVHPSLLPAYPGLRAMETSFDEGALMGATVHIVTAEMDAGPRLLQREVRPSVRGESGWTSARTLMAMAEHRLVREAASRWR